MVNSQNKQDGDWNRGYLHIYTGDGKGKTTAALGLALRAAGAGLKVLIIQFVKGMSYCELESLKRFSDLITVRQCGRNCFINREPEPEDIECARRGLEKAREALASGEYRLVILDEANIAVHFGLFAPGDLLEAVGSRRPEVEVVVTGRRAAPELLEAADLVTEMKEVKHYFSRGVPARRGIEK